MRFRERDRDCRTGGSGGSPASSPGGGLDNLRAAARNVVRTGDEAIERSLEGCSEDALSALLQEGGQ